MSSALKQVYLLKHEQLSTNFVREKQIDVAPVFLSFKKSITVHTPQSSAHSVVY